MKENIYDEPLDIFDKNNKCKYAYIIYINNDIEIAGAIVTSHSIRHSGSMIDIIIIVNYEADHKVTQILGSYCNKILNIKEIHKLLDYTKILIMDTNTIIIKKYDHLFTLNLPAACVIKKKDKKNMINYDKEGKYVVPTYEKIKKFKKICRQSYNDIFFDIHDDKINGDMIVGPILIKPDVYDINEIINTNIKYMIKKHKKWTHINPMFVGLYGFPDWSYLYGITFSKDKPYIIKNKKEINHLIKYPSFVLWHEYYAEVIKNHQEYLTNKLLYQSNEMHLYFHSSLKNKKILISRVNENSEKIYQQIPLKEIDEIENVNLVKNKNIISKAFDVNENEIHNDQLKYYFTDRDICYSGIKIKTMWDDIKEYDYIEPIRRLAKYYGDTSYYSKILKIYEESYDNKAEKLDIQFTSLYINPADKDLIMLEYVKCRKNIYVVTLWPILLKKMKIEKIIKIFEKFGHICYVKTISISKKALFNLLFWMYDEYTYTYRYDYIYKKIELIESTELNDITLLFLDNVDNKYEPTEKNNIQKELLIDINDDTKYVNDDDLFHINDNYYQTITYSQILLNENTLDMLEMQNIENIINPLMIDSHLKLQTFKKWNMMNLSLLELGRMIIIGGTILYSCGFRKLNNIDGIFISVNNDESQSEIELNELIHVNFGEDKTKFYFSDIHLEKSDYWKDNFSEKYNEILSYFDIDDFIELSTDPKYHYYFQGLKCCLLSFELLSKIKKNKAKDHADLIILATLYPKSLSKYIQFNKKTLIYKSKINVKPLAYNQEYYKKLIYLISKRYTKKDVDKFRRISKI